MRSGVPLVREKGSKVKIVMFHHGEEPLAEATRLGTEEMGIEIVELPQAPNGANLNRQIEMALKGGYDFFYRVDADDLVYEDRFSRQAKILMTTEHDLVGGGLVYHDVTTGEKFNVQPRETPGTGDFLSNIFVLHPTIALRLSTIKKHDIRYWHQRLEDKRLALEYDALGLSVYNDPALYGEYNLNPKARNARSFARLSFRLNLRYLNQNHKFLAYPRALVMYLLHLWLPNQRLRKLRRQLHRVEQALKRRPSS